MEPKSFAGTLDSLSLIREYVTSAANSAGLDRKATYGLCLAVDEIATNIIVHGYEGAGRSGVLDMRTEMESGTLTVIIEDDGVAFDPRENKLPDSEDFSKPLENRPIGGLGVFLAFDGVDEFKYERSGGRNRNIFVVHHQSHTNT
jgi:anti-sigma regulatory factor (Ser/Thr protein kinase)